MTDFSLSRLQISIVIVGLVSSSLSHSRIYGNEGDNKAEEIQRAITIRQRLLNATPEEIMEFRLDDDTALALSASWMKLQRQMDAKFLGDDRGAILIPVHEELVTEFVGFVEGRLRVSPPDGWLLNLYSAQFTRWSSAHFYGEQNPNSLENGRTNSTEYDYRSPDFQSLRDRVSTPVVVPLIEEHEQPHMLHFMGSPRLFEGEDAYAVIPKEILAATMKDIETFGEGHLQGIAQGNTAFVVNNQGHPGFQELYCIATGTSENSAKLHWKKQLDSYWGTGFKGSGWFTQCRIRKDQIYLFHCCNDSIGIECLNTVDGSRVFSFNSKLPPVIKDFSNPPELN